MNRPIAALVVSLSLGTAAVGAQAVLAEGYTQSASGASETTVEGQQRTLAFTAVKLSDGTVRGQALIINRVNAFRTHVEIDCLKIVDNVALISGVITRADERDDPGVVGWTRAFAVQDNGQGADAPDQVTSTSFVFPPGTLTCLDFEPADAAPFFVPIEAGNIQVR
jgi:hypothetical protein